MERRLEDLRVRDPGQIDPIVRLCDRRQDSRRDDDRDADTREMVDANIADIGIADIGIAGAEAGIADIVDTHISDADVADIASAHIGQADEFRTHLQGRTAPVAAVA